jgi:hypothetical protein
VSDDPAIGLRPYAPNLSCNPLGADAASHGDAQGPAVSARQADRHLAGDLRDPPAAMAPRRQGAVR